MKILSMIQQRLNSKMFMVGLFLLFFLLSWVGVYISEPYGKPLLTAAYDAIALFALNGSGLPAVSDWLWNEHNYLLLVMLWLDALYLVLAVFSLFTEKTMLYALSTGAKDNNITVCGLGEWGLHYVKALVASGFHVVVIEKNPTQRALDQLIALRIQNKKVSLIVGNCFDDAMLAKAFAHHASKILPMLPTDADNIDFAYKARRFLIQKKKTNPVILLPVDDIRLSTSLATYKRFSDHNSEVEIRFFNIMQQAGVRHLNQYPPEVYADIFNQDNVHFAIYGLGSFAINLIYVIAHLGHYRTWEQHEDNESLQSKRVKITIYDQKPQADAMDDLHALFPQLNHIIDIEYKQTSLMTLDFSAELENTRSPITQHFFCMSDEALTVRYATKLRKRQMLTTSSNTPIFVRSLDGKGLSRLIESNCGEDEWPDSIFPLVLLPSKLGEHDYFSQYIDNLAKSFNDYKITKKELSKKNKEDCWPSLSADFKHSSFYQAFYLSVRLRAIGYQWLPESKSDKFPVSAWENEPDLYQHIAHLEHDRWKSERWLLGWSHNNERTLGDIARLHPQLERKDSNQMWEPIYDVEQAKFLSKYIEQAGCNLVRNDVVKHAEDLHSGNTYIFNLLHAE